MTKTIKKNDKNVFIIIAECLKKEGVVAIKTDTIYGLSSLPNGMGEERIYAIKKRDINKHLIILCTNSTYHLYSSFVIPEDIKDEYKSRPTTFIVPSNNKGDSVALRIQKEGTFLATLIDDYLKCGITSTSVNIEGKPPLLTPKEIQTAFGDKIDLLVWEEMDNISVSPSNIVKVDSDGRTFKIR